MFLYYYLLNDKKKRSKSLVQGPGVKKTFRHTKQINVMFRTCPVIIIESLPHLIGDYVN